MPKQGESKKHINYILIPFLLVIWCLVKIGSLPILLIKLIISQVSKISKFKFNFAIPSPKFSLPKINLPKITLPKFKIDKTPAKKSYKPANLAILNPRKKPKQFNFPKVTFPSISFPKFSFPRLIKKGRGRPRTQPLAPFLIKKFNNFMDVIYPKPLRVLTLVAIILSGFFFYSLYLIDLSHNLPSPERLSVGSGPQTTEFYDRQGRLLYRLYEGKNRTLTKLEEIPDHLVKATIAIEDKNFYSHSGVDFLGVSRAIWSNLNNERIEQGGSTITQQLIKNTLLTFDVTWERKIREVLLAFWAERIFNKAQILQMYFNEVAYGGPAWGIQAASQTYFNKDVRDLTLAESSYLAGLPASPTTYSPYGANPELGKARQKEVLRRMVEDGYITEEQSTKAYDTQLNINPPVTSIKAPHFVMYVRQQLSQKYGEKVVSQGGLKVYTTLDLDIQQAAETIVSEEVAKLANMKVSNGAAMITDSKTGHILAMVGSKNYFDSKGGNFNVTTALRQPGSSIKPITYATGFKTGYSPGNILLDTPVSFKNAWETYAPVNYDGKFHGPVTIRQALGSSYNIPAVKMLAIVGIPQMVQTATDMGITTFNEPDRYGLSLTLGGAEVKLIDMMTAYGTFSQSGVKYDTQPILKIVDSDGVILEDNKEPLGKRVIPASTAFLISDILSDNKARTPAFGQNSLLNIPNHTVAVKTGTTDSKRDNWTFGYTPEYVVGVWVGNNDNSPMDPNLSSGVTGAAPIWNKIMTLILEGKRDLAFERPLDVVEAVVDGKKDLVVAGQAPKTIATLGKKKIKDEKTKEEKDTITFTDPFSTFIQGETKIP